MNLKLSILLVTVLLIFGGAFLVVRLTSTENTAPIRPWLYRMDDSSIFNISVTHQGQTIEYSKNPGTLDWYIQGSQGTLVFQDLWGGTPFLLSGPRVSRAVSEKLDKPANFGLEPPQTRVLVTDRNGNTIEFHLGDATPDTLDQYVRLVGEDALFTVPVVWGNVIDLLATAPPYLRLFQVDEDRMSSIEITYQEQSVTFERDQALNTWIFPDPDGGPVSEEKWGDSAKMISGPRVDERIAMDLVNPAQYGLEPPEIKVRIGMRGRLSIEFHLGHATEDGEHRYARLKGEPELYIMPVDRVQRIINLAVDPPYSAGVGRSTPNPG